jgi:hydroxymethylglutaryl-CoA synthase
VQGLQAGIVGCGVYIPRLRIKREEYQRVWGYSSRWVEEKSVADFDEDTITMGVEAASNALRNARVDSSEIDALYFTSTSPPYAEKQNASTIATALGCRSDIATVDITSSTKSGTSALLSCLDFVNSGRGRLGLVVASDCPRSDPIGMLEHQLGAAAAAMIVGTEQVRGLVEESYSIVSESLGERFRRDGEGYVTAIDLGPYHETVLREVITSCVGGVMRKLHRSSEDYDFLVLGGIDAGKASEVSRKLGFEDSKMSLGMVSTKVGDAGAASSLLALSKVLESASVGQHVICCSYGAGAGADAISFAAGAEVRQAAGARYEDYLAKKEYIDYTTYIKIRRILARH